MDIRSQILLGGAGGRWVYKHRNQSQSLRAGEKLITKQNTTFDEVFLKVCVGDC